MAFEGLPDPVYCAGGGYGCPFRTGGGAHLVLPDGTLLRTVLVYLGGAHANPNPGSRPYSTSVVAFASRDGGFHWRYRGVVLDSAGAPESQEGPSENALALLRDGRTVLCVLRLDAGDSKVNRSHYLPYARVTSADGGATWSAPVLLADVHGAPMGAARPRLLRLKGGGGALVLAGGRLSATNHDPRLWLNAAGDGVAWAPYSVSAVHNRLVANATYRFTAGVNTSGLHGGQSSCYSSLLGVEGGGVGLLLYEVTYAPPWSKMLNALTFALRFSVVGDGGR